MIAHKIRGIPKEICTAEQMIAYKLSFRYADIITVGFKDIRNKAACIKSEFVQKSINTLIHLYKTCKDSEKYNIDVIFCALNAGLEKYLKSGCPILCTYDNVGKMFPLYY